MTALLDFAILANRVYSDKPQFGSEDSASRAVVYNDNTPAFPGTNNIACWLADLNFDTKKVEGMGEVHEGFHDAYSALAPQLMALTGTKYVTGHSEGAALALMHAADLCLAGRPPVAVYAFEPPRVSVDDTLAKLFQAHSVKLILTNHGNDVVPMVPRAVGDWRHPGELLPIPGAKHWFPNVDDHMMDGVIADIQKYNIQ